MIRTLLAAASLSLLSLAALGTAHAAGRLEVRYVEPEKFTDAGFGAVERERTQGLLTQRLERLARALPEGQLLRVEFTDVDLAGEVDTLSFHRVRVMGQLPDAPRLSLRYELRQGDTVLARGEERLSDVAYMSRSRLRAGSDEPLVYEGRLLDDWFGQRIAKTAAVR